MSLRGQLKPLLELESGSNDQRPSSDHRTHSIALNAGSSSGISCPPFFIFQMGLGAAFGFGLGKAMVFSEPPEARLRREYTLCSLWHSPHLCRATAASGSGFLAVYIAGLVASNSEFIRKKKPPAILRWTRLAQPDRNVCHLGLLVFPSQIIPIMGLGLLVSGFLMLVARPLSVFISLSLSKFQWREKAFISWVGLLTLLSPSCLRHFRSGRPSRCRVAVQPCFFIVLTSALFKAGQFRLPARVFKVDAPPAQAAVSSGILPVRELTPNSSV